MPEFTGDYWGRRVRVVCDESELFKEICALLPRAPSVESSADTEYRFQLEGPDSGLFHDGQKLTANLASQGLLDCLENAFLVDVACHAPDGVFVHAGAVELVGRCMILPGSSHAGKSTLVLELVQRAPTISPTNTPSSTPRATSTPTFVRSRHGNQAPSRVPAKVLASRTIPP